LPNEYIFYSTMFWFGVACVGGLVVTAILMIARSCIKSKSEKSQLTE
jgi:formate-dependent nitrite reductase membrane component NrfD